MHDLFPNRTDGCHSSSRQKQKRAVGVAFKEGDLPKHSASVGKLDNRTKILGKSCLGDLQEPRSLPKLVCHRF